MVDLFITSTNKYIGVFSIINVWIRRDKWSEEDIHPMENPQPNIVPPMARIPQVPPQQVAGNRRVYIPPTFRRVTTPPNRFVPRPYIVHRHVYIAPSLTRLPAYQYSPLWQQMTQTSDEHIAPVIKLPAKLRKPLMQQGVPETPGLLSAELSPIREIQPDFLIRTSQMDIPATPPYSIPGYLASEVECQGPGVGETLLGCGMLFLLGIIALVILYYLAT